MKVLEIGTKELALIDEALEEYQECMEEHLDMYDEEDILEAQDDIARIKTTRALLKRQRLQELCERCLSYFWDEYKMTGDFGDLVDDMGIENEELVELFKAAGFEEEE